jgi:hypothetical protein
LRAVDHVGRPAGESPNPGQPGVEQRVLDDLLAEVAVPPFGKACPVGLGLCTTCFPLVLAYPGECWHIGGDVSAGVPGRAGFYEHRVELRLSPTTAVGAVIDDVLTGPDRLALERRSFGDDSLEFRLEGVYGPLSFSFWVWCRRRSKRSYAHRWGTHFARLRNKRRFLPYEEEQLVINSFINNASA